MLIEAKFRYAIKEMMLSKPLEEINVTTLCQKCGCHRQTFYYHYQDIYDLLGSVFLDEKIQGLNESSSINETLHALNDYVMSNFNFIQRSYDSAAKDLVEDFFYGATTNKLNKLIENEASFNLTRAESRVLSRRLSSAVVKELGIYLKDNTSTAPKASKKMSKFIDAMVSDGINGMVAVIKKERKR